MPDVLHQMDWCFGTDGNAGRAAVRKRIVPVERKYLYLVAGLRPEDPLRGHPPPLQLIGRGLDRARGAPAQVELRTTHRCLAMEEYTDVREACCTALPALDCCAVQHSPAPP